MLLLRIVGLAVASMFWPLLLAVVVIALQSERPLRVLLAFYLGGFLTATVRSGRGGASGVSVPKAQRTRCRVARLAARSRNLVPSGFGPTLASSRAPGLPPIGWRLAKGGVART